MVRCRHKIGLLTLKDCGIEQETICSECGKPICKNHLRTLNNKIFCIECFLKLEENKDKEELDEELKHENSRILYYSQFAYIPFYRSGYYGDFDDDYESFDSDIDSDIEYEYDDDIEIDDFQDS